MCNYGEWLFTEGREEGREQGREEGREQGREEGREQGREEGREQGREEGRALGREQGQASLIAAMLKAQMPAAQIQSLLTQDKKMTQEQARKFIDRVAAAVTA